MSHPLGHARRMTNARSLTDSFPHPRSNDLVSVPDERLEAELCQLAADIAAGTARWFRLIAEYDRRQVWSSWECRSMAHWLAAHVGVSLVTARQYVLVARTLESYPSLSMEFDAGRLSYSRVRAVCRVITPQTEADLVEMARHATAPQLEKFVVAVERATRRNEDDEVGPHERRQLVFITEDDGTVTVRAKLSAEAGTALRRAVEFEVERRRSVGFAEMTQEQRDEVKRSETPFGQLRADALVELVAAGHTNLSTSPVDGDRHVGAPSCSRDAAASLRPLIVVHRYPTGDELERGPAVSQRKADRLSVHADHLNATHLAVVGGGPADTNQSTVDRRVVYSRLGARSASASQRRAMFERDQGCRFTGCGRLAGLHAHHIHEHRHGGATVTHNLILLCAWHHHAVHRNGWIITGSPSGALTFNHPRKSRPSPVEPRELVAEHGSAGPIHPAGRGERFDEALAVEALLHNSTVRDAQLA